MDPAATSVSKHVRVVGAAPTHEVALPEIDNAPTYDAPVLDRIGGVVRDQSWLPIVAALAGGGLTAARAMGSDHGALRRVAGPIGGALAGAALAIGGGVLVGRLFGGEAKGAAEAGAPVASGRVVADENLRVMSFNLHGGMGPAGEFGTSDEKLDRLAAAIRREDPDVVMLQEIDRFAVRSDHRDILAELAKRLQPDGAVFTPRGSKVSGGQEGTGMLTFNGVEVADARGIVSTDPRGDGVLRRLDGLVSGARKLWAKEVTRGEAPTGLTPDYMPRVTTDAMLVTPAGNQVRVLSGHYSWELPGIPSQENQIVPLAGMVDAWSGPTIWGADWNQRDDRPTGARERELLGAADLSDTFSDMGIEPGDPRRRTAGGSVPHEAIDRIYRSSEFTTRDVRVAPYADGEPDTSDHHAVVADLRLEAD